jgi:Family of unknown function (DUF5335)
MNTKQIMPIDYQEFFDGISQKLNGATVDVEILGADIGAQTQTVGLMFEGLTSEDDEVTGAGVKIMIGDNAAAHITHSISSLKEVNAEEIDDAKIRSLELKSSDGTIALMRFY